MAWSLIAMRRQLSQGVDWPSGGWSIPNDSGGVPHGRHAQRPGRRGPHGAPVPSGGSFVPFPIEAIGRSVGDRFEEQARAHPDRVAVKTPGRTVRYGELDREANRMARGVLAAGASGKPVAILMEKDAAKVAAILGVLKAGACYVPLSASYPRARNEQILADSRAPVLLTDDANLETARRVAGSAGGPAVLDVSAGGSWTSGEEAEAGLGLEVSPDAYAYVLYTSGSTGRPKGIVETHRNLLHNVRNATNDQRYSRDDTILCANSFAFSGSLKNLFGALLNGGALAPFEVEREGLDALERRISEDGITVFEAVSTLFRQFAEGLPEGRVFPGVRLVRLGGEGVSARDYALFRAHFPESCVMINGYGVTETGTIRVFVMDREIGPGADGTVPIGYPVEGVDVLLLDESGLEVPTGEVGEIVVRGAYLSPGYWNDPSATAAAFSPADGGLRLYRTGDLGRLLPDGCLVHMGRSDSQVKIRGNRVELAEVELALSRAPGVKEGIVVARDDLPADRCLVGYVLPDRASGSTARAPEPRDLRLFLAGRLPSHALPSAFVVLEEWPVSPNGKLDRKALPPPSRQYVAPRDEVERRLAEIWEDVMDIPSIGVVDDFFELGGYSLKASALLARVGEAFGVALPQDTLLRAPTIGAMAGLVAGGPPEGPPSLVVAVHALGSKPPFFCVPGSEAHILSIYHLVQALDPDRPSYGLQLPDAAPGAWPSIEEMAAPIVDELLEIRPDGPFSLGGHSFGGVVAYEVAQQLIARGREVDLLALFDTLGKGFPRRGTRLLSVLDHLEILARLPLEGKVSYLRERAARRLETWKGRLRRVDARKLAESGSAIDHRPPDEREVVTPRREINRRAWQAYQPRTYPGRLTIFRAVEQPRWPGYRFDDPTLGWGPLALGGVEVHEVPGDHLSHIFDPEKAQVLARSLRAVLP